ncbi:MAG: TrkA C-terminal domain-containing protein [Chloroflexi bacterium]|nr:TrkA C-terminal domain-containing protein [Chloroflexota bacterium]
MAILLSFLVVRAASILLMMTGMDEQKARFQALSAFTGTGFTTREAENVVNHPQRRRIVMWLMTIGYAGIVTVIVTATSSLITSRGGWETALIFGVVVLYVYALFLLAKYSGFTRRWESFISRRLARYSIEDGTPEELLHLVQGYGIVRIAVKPDWPLVDSCVSQETCRDQGLLVIGIERGNHWMPLPKPNEKLNDGDKIVIYGSLDAMGNISTVKNSPAQNP